MRSFDRRRKAIAISNPRWAAYAAAGAATALVGIPAAEAEIHYSGIVNHKFPGGQLSSHANFPLNNGASLSFLHGSYLGKGEAFLAIPAPGVFKTFGAFVGSLVHYGGFYLSNLDGRINLSGLQFKNSCRFSSSSSTTNCYGGTIGRGGGAGSVNGKFREPGTGFIGFEFNSGAGVQYGWVRIKTKGLPKDKFVVLDYAWGDPGDAIQTGQKHGPSQSGSVPEKGSIGVLAVGAAGLLAWRRKRQQ
jgi:hypothetical protein